LVSSDLPLPKSIVSLFGPSSVSFSVSVALFSGASLFVPLSLPASGSKTGGASSFPPSGSKTGGASSFSELLDFESPELFVLVGGAS